MQLQAENKAVIAVGKVLKSLRKNHKYFGSRRGRIATKGGAKQAGLSEVVVT